MSSTIQQSSRSVLSVLKPTRRRLVCKCSHSSHPSRLQQRNLSAFAPRLQQQQDTSVQNEPTTTSPPRWSRTPPAMAAPLRAKPYPPNYRPFPVNKSPDNLDTMYTKFLGKSGPKMLSDETKWLAVTHKSFDHGRRGFNDRLAFLGMQNSQLEQEGSVLTYGQGNEY